MQLPRKMSAQNVMASISRTLGNRHDGNTKHSNEVKLAGEESKDKLYEPKHRQKVVRVLTVVAYVVSVSLAAIVLSLYYTFIWDPKGQHKHYPNKTNSLNAGAKIECINLTIPVIVGLVSTNGSLVTKLPTKSLTNETELLQKITSSLQTNEEDLNEIAVPGFTENAEAESVTKSEVSAIVPAIVQPESGFVDKSQESKDQPSQDVDFGFI